MPPKRGARNHSVGVEIKIPRGLAERENSIHEFRSQL